MGLHSKCVIEGPPNTMVMFEYGIDQEARSPPVKQTCSVEEGGPAWTTPYYGSVALSFIRVPATLAHLVK